MTCTYCGDKGWVENWVGTGNSWTPSLNQCIKRCNINGYSNEVQKRLNDPKHVTASPVLATPPPVLKASIGDLLGSNVIPFRPRQTVG